MLKVRIIPTLLYKDTTLVKGIKFDSWRRIGFIMQAIKVYNIRQVDELIFLDITATKEGREPDYMLVDDFADDCFMPLTVGGGIRNIEHVRIKCIRDMNICQERHTDIGSPPKEKVLLSVKAEFTLINLIDSIFESVSLMAGTPKATRLYMEHVMKICKERMKAVEEGRSKLYTMEEVRKKLNLKRSKGDETP